MQMQTSVNYHVKFIKIYPVKCISYMVPCSDRVTPTL